MVLLVAASASECLAQQIEQDNPWFVRAGFTHSYVLPTNSLLRSTWSENPTIEIGRQTDGSRKWHHMYGLPAYGFGFSFASFGEERLGEPHEAYAFLSWPFARLADDIDLTTDFSMGLSWHWHPFDERSNADNTVIGSDLNFRFDWGFYVRTTLTPRVAVYSGVDFTHRSNGEYRQPNDGINVIGPRVMLRYNLGDQRNEPIPVLEPRPPPFRPSWATLVAATVSRKDLIEQHAPIVRAEFDAANVTLDVQRHFYKYGKAVGGVELAYDGSTNAHIDSTTGVPTRAAVSERWTLGVYGGYEHIIGRLGVVGEVGYVAVRTLADASSPRLYERYGWRYHVSSRVSAILAMRLIQGFDATQVEVGAAYRLR